MPGESLMAGETAEDRRARAAQDPARWRVGESAGTHGRNIYQGTEQLLVAFDPAVATQAVEDLNRVAELVQALQEIMRATDPGDIRLTSARRAWEAVNPARRIAREALGGTIGGYPSPGDALDAERRGHTPT